MGVFNVLLNSFWYFIFLLQFYITFFLIYFYMPQTFSGIRSRLYFNIA